METQRDPLVTADPAFITVRDCVVDVLQVKPGDVLPEANFRDDLAATSLSLTEVIMAVEEAFGLDIEESEMDGLDTVGELYALVLRLR